MSSLFSPIAFRHLALRNRIGVSPMCQYSSEDGFATDWHVVHIGARAVGGAGMVIMEATGVSPEGRITPGCLGIWKDEHITTLKRVTAFAKEQGAVIGIQLAHAGRKAGTDLPWKGGKFLSLQEGGWQAYGPSALPFSKTSPAPREMHAEDILKVKNDFVAGAKRAVEAGFQVLEIHGAHGYLLNSFFSGLANKRQDEYGGSLENRGRLMLEIAEGIRAAVPEDVVIGARLGCSDWAAGGITLEDSIWLAGELKKRGIDFIDCSSGGMVPEAKVEIGPNYQVPFAKGIRHAVKIPTCAVGMINDARQADDIVKNGEADMVFLARAMLRDPYWPIHAAKELGVEAPVPKQYLRGY